MGAWGCGRSGTAGLAVSAAVAPGAWRHPQTPPATASYCRLPLGIKALATSPMRPGKGDVGQRDVPVVVGGVAIAPGDWLYSDEGGHAGLIHVCVCVWWGAMGAVLGHHPRCLAVLGQR